MVEKLKYSGPLCSSGIIVSFSGVSLQLDTRYKVQFESINTIPYDANAMLNPTGYFLTPSEKSPIISTIFSAKSNISDNSSINLIALKLYDQKQNLIHTDYKSITCENLCGSGVVIPPTPSVTPTLTPTLTPQPTPAASPPPLPSLLNMRANFDRTINNSLTCNNILVKAKAYGSVGQSYFYTFGTDMGGVDLQISNPSGYIVLSENPTYIYTTITLPESCKNYILEFGLSDGTNAVQSAASFNCGNC